MATAARAEHSQDAPDNRSALLSYYGKWVNGTGLPTLRALYGGRPGGSPVSARPIAPGRPLAGITLDAPAPDLRGLPRLAPERLRPVRHIILHGSQATGDACAFSDVDIVVVLDDSRECTATEHRNAVHELKRLLHAVYRLDTLMHHGLMFALASDFQQYDQSFLPVETFRRSHALYGPAMLPVRVVEPNGEKVRRRAQRAIALLREQAETDAWQLNDYAFKRFISNVLLVPALVAAVRGRYVYKKDSFGIVQEWFTPLDWTGIARAEEFRTMWIRPRAPALSQLASFGPHPCVQIRAMLRRPPRLNADRLLRDHPGLWRQELRRVFARAAELVC